MSVRVFGVRHHGPGSARSLLREFDAWRPDLVLLEGPPEADGLSLEGLVPPVAILVYDPDDAESTSIFPMAEFSPEFVALKWAAEQEVPTRFIDPLGTREEAALGDPLGELARHLGHDDLERFWDAVIERREAPFEALLDLVREAREGLAIPLGTFEREAAMRQRIHAATKEGFERIAVVCGAFHAPALAEAPKRGEATPIKKSRRRATWAPWTYERMSSGSGYAAGVLSPAYYEALWHHAGDELASAWLLRAARLLRREGLDASPASVIESVRLADALTAMRGHSTPGLFELLEAAWSVLCGGQNVPLKLIEAQLVIGDRLGAVPETTPQAPLQADLAALQKRLRLKPEGLAKPLDLDLRNDNDRARSHLLHRLGILDTPWGVLQPKRPGVSTFHEVWMMAWKAEFAVTLIEAGRWGTTIEAAATVKAVDLARSSPELPTLGALAGRVLDADLQGAVPSVMRCLENAAALAGDALELLDALPPLAQVLRYGNVRKTDTQAAAHVFETIFARACIGLPPACAGLNDEAAEDVVPRLDETQSIVSLLEDAELKEAWAEALLKLVNQSNGQGLIVGRATRHLLDSGKMPLVEVKDRLARLASPGTAALQVAFWVEGFVGGSGQILIHDEGLFDLVDEWMTSLPGEVFDDLLPLLRRTFASFSAPERRQLGDRVTRGGSLVPKAVVSDLDLDRAERVLPLVRKLLGIREDA